MLNRFTQFILQSRRQAIIAALCCTLLPLLNWVSAVIIGTVTLVKGPYEGFVVLLWVALPYAVLAAKGMLFPLLTNLVFGGVLVWVAAICLRRIGKWSVVLNGLVCLALLAILLLHWLKPDITQLWVQQLTGLMSQIPAGLKQHLLAQGQANQLIQLAAQYATGMQAVYVIFAVLTNLALARMLQGRLFYPGLLRREWLRLRLGFVAIFLLLLVIAGALWGPAVALDLVPVVLLPGLIVGVSVLHNYFLKFKSARMVWLFVLFMLFSMIMPLIAMGLLILLSMLDQMVFYRRAI